MMLTSLSTFIYSTCVAVSHITIVQEEPEVLLFGLYANLLENDMQPVVFQCNFQQLNDLLSLADFVADETIEELAGVVALDLGELPAIDVTAQGGLHFTHVLFCIEVFEKNGSNGISALHDDREYYLHSFITKAASIPNFEPTQLPGNAQQLANHYFSLLSIRYDFYLHFCQQKMPLNEALTCSGLQDELIFCIAKTGYELRNLIQAQ